MKVENHNQGKKRYKVDSFISDNKVPKLSKYMNLIVGEHRFLYLLKFEIIMLFASWVPGAVGFVLRSKLYPLILGSNGKGVVFGRNITFRYPLKIHIGDNCIIDDNCLLDAKGENNRGITIGNNVYIGRNTILSCKDGDIALKDNVNIGFNCEIFSSSRVVLEDFALIAAYCYIVGGGNYEQRVTGLPISRQPIMDSKGIVLEKNCWLGARVTVLDGSRIGNDSIVGAASLVNSDIPPFSIAVGAPCRVVKKRPLA